MPTTYGLQVWTRPDDIQRRKFMYRLAVDNTTVTDIFASGDRDNAAKRKRKHGG